MEVLRWARANGCLWKARTRDRAAAKLGYTDDLGNLVGDDDGNPVQFDYDRNPVQFDYDGNPVQFDYDGNPVQ